MDDHAPAGSGLEARLTDLQRRLDACVSAGEPLTIVSEFAKSFTPQELGGLTALAREDGRAAVALGLLHLLIAAEPEGASASAARAYRDLLAEPPPPMTAVPLASLFESPAELATRLGISVLPFVTEGLGPCRGIVFQSATGDHWFSQWWESRLDPKTADLEVRPPVADSAALSELLETACVCEADLAWISPHADLDALPLRRLDRIDDHGHRDAVVRSRSLAWLERQRSEYERQGHKQRYEIREADRPE